MTVEDWVMAVGLIPLIVAAGWIQTYRIWRRQADVSPGVSWATGQSGGAGMHAFVLPISVAFTVAWVGIVLGEVGDGVSREQPLLDSASTWLVTAAIPIMLLAFWLGLFMWPRFLVPPHLRGQPGWLVAASRSGGRGADGGR